MLDVLFYFPWLYSFEVVSLTEPGPGARLEASNRRGPPILIPLPDWFADAHIYASHFVWILEVWMLAFVMAQELLTLLAIYLANVSLYNKSEFWRLNPCSYAFKSRSGWAISPSMFYRVVGCLHIFIVEISHWIFLRVIQLYWGFLVCAQYGFIV